MWRFTPAGDDEIHTLEPRCLGERQNDLPVAVRRNGFGEAAGIGQDEEPAAPFFRQTGYQLIETESAQ